MASSSSPSSSDPPAAEYQPSHERLHVVRSISDPSPTNAFVKFVNRESKNYRGRDGHNQARHFVPHGPLNHYWTTPASKIRVVCESYSSNIYHTFHTQTIITTYLRVFSTLVYAGILAYLPDFLEHGLTDERFPSHDLPMVWKDCPPQREMFNKFKEHQWRFFPVVLDSRKLATTRLLNERILPILSQVEIRKSDATVIYKVQFHDSGDRQFFVSRAICIRAKVSC